MAHRGVGDRGLSGGVGVVLGTGRECRYSGANRSIGGIRGIGVPMGCQGCIGAGRKCRYQGSAWV